MNFTLDILIAHHNESVDIVNRCLESLPKSDNIHIKIYNDGNENVLHNMAYPYRVCERQGISKLRNLMLQESSGDYIWFIDCDDYLLTDNIRYVIDAIDKYDPDLISLGCKRESPDGTLTYCVSRYCGFSILGCNIFKRIFLIENNLQCNESTFLAGDIALEQLPKWYTKNKIIINIPILFYCYNPLSCVNNQKNNGWNVDRINTISYYIDKLLNDKKFSEAYIEYMNIVLILNNKYIHDKYLNIFKKLGLYKLNFRKDLR